MIAGLGTAALLAALAGAVWLTMAGITAARRPSTADRARIGGAVALLLGGAVAGFVALEWAILADDFTVEYVAETSARSTP
ncbi:MAG: hypothetical protein WKF93_04060, partial [Acidimicrobiales bacterium]